MISITDISLTCRDCSHVFTFTASEQEFYNDRGFVPPSRCPECRAVRRQEREALAQRAAASRVVNDGFREPRPLFPAVCVDCGRQTMVPFEPRPGRMVFCRECFQHHKDEYRAQ